jgi:hypothetical protein
MTIKQLGGVFGRNPTFNDVTIEGTLTFDGALDINSDINLPDNKKITFGDGEDLQIYHDGSNSVIKESGTGELQIRGTDLKLQDADGNNYISMIDGGTGGTVYLKHNGVDKLATTSTGIDVTGNVNISGTDNRPLAITSFDTASAGAGWDLDATSISGVVTISTGGSERMRIDSSGTVIVNNGGTGNGLIKINGATGNTEAIIFQRGGTEASRIGHSNSADLTFSTGSGTTERMRLDSSGNLLVGKTSASSATVGFQAGQDGFIAATRTSSEPLVLNRLTSDGLIASFRKDGAQVGSIGATSGRLYIGDGDVALRFSDDLDFISPWDASTNAARDGAIDLGNAGNRFKDIYATNGTIQTSDRNEKQDIEAPSDAEQRVAVAAKGLLRKFRWKSAVEEKGENARIHFGIIAQDLQAAFEAEGLDAGRYGMFINSTWTDEETGEERSRMGVRYSELLAFIISAI